MVKSFLESVPEVYRALYPAESDLLVKICNICCPETTVPILLMIKEVIQADVTYMKSPLDLRNQRAFAVKPGLSGMLDIARQTYRELTDYIHQYINGVGGTCSDYHKLSLGLQSSHSICLQNSIELQ